GLSQEDGEVIWVMRVGIDTGQLPVRVPRTPSAPEIALVLSADTLTLTAVNVLNGATLWRRPLGSECLGRPVVIERRAYLATHDGYVHEIELDGGKEQGRYNLGQSLSLGGTRREGTSHVYFPADDNCVYVLDVANHTCHAILYTGHGAGSLR